MEDSSSSGAGISAPRSFNNGASSFLQSDEPSIAGRASSLPKRTELLLNSLVYGDVTGDAELPTDTIASSIPSPSAAVSDHDKNPRAAIKAPRQTPVSPRIGQETRRYLDALVVPVEVADEAPIETPEDPKSPVSFSSAASGYNNDTKREYREKLRQRKPAQHSFADRDHAPRFAVMPRFGHIPQQAVTVRSGDDDEIEVKHRRPVRQLSRNAKQLEPALLEFEEKDMPLHAELPAIRPERMRAKMNRVDYANLFDQFMPPEIIQENRGNILPEDYTANILDAIAQLQPLFASRSPEWTAVSELENIRGSDRIGKVVDEMTALHYVNQSVPDRLFARFEAALTAGRRFEDVFAEVRAELEPVALLQAPDVDDQPGPSTRPVPQQKLAEVELKEASAADSVPDETFLFGGEEEGIGAVEDNVDVNRFLSEQEQGIYQNVLQLFPAIDPQYVVEQIATEGYTLDFLVDKLTGSDDYPKREQRIKREKVNRRRNELLDTKKFSIVDFLQTFPDPIAFFTNVDRSVSALYVRHAQIQLQNDFPFIMEDFIREKLSSHNNHYLPTKQELAAIQATMHEPRGKGRHKRARLQCFLTVPRTAESNWPEELDEGFFREVQFSINENRIRKSVNNRTLNRQRDIAKAREDGTLVECDICCNECLPEDLIGCAEGHRFCCGCVQKYAETVLGGEGKASVDCLTQCGSSFKVEQLKKVLSPNLFSLLLRRQSEESLEQLRKTLAERAEETKEIVENCPFCPYMCLMDSTPEEDRVFRCQNQECLKDSCRLCRNASHIPLRCNEVDQASMERFIENQMAEAMIRSCPNCKTRVIKDSGCNHMTCSRCRSHFCYICNEIMETSNPYKHFENGKCVPHSADYDLHGKLAEKAGKEALDRFLAKNPNAKIGDKSKVDISKLIDKTDPAKAHAFGHFRGMQAEFMEMLIARQQGLVLPVAVRGEAEMRAPQALMLDLARREARHRRIQAEVFVQRRNAEDAIRRQRQQRYADLVLDAVAVGTQLAPAAASNAPTTEVDLAPRRPLPLPDARTAHAEQQELSDDSGRLRDRLQRYRQLAVGQRRSNADLQPGRHAVVDLPYPAHAPLLGLQRSANPAAMDPALAAAAAPAPDADLTARPLPAHDATTIRDRARQLESRMQRYRQVTDYHHRPLNADVQPERNAYVEFPDHGEFVRMLGLERIANPQATLSTDAPGRGINIGPLPLRLPIGYLPRQRLQGHPDTSGIGRTNDFETNAYRLLPQRAAHTGELLSEAFPNSAATLDAASSSTSNNNASSSLLEPPQAQRPHFANTGEFSLRPVLTRLNAETHIQQGIFEDLRPPTSGFTPLSPPDASVFASAQAPPLIRVPTVRPVARVPATIAARPPQLVSGTRTTRLASNGEAFDLSVGSPSHSQSSQFLRQDLPGTGPSIQTASLNPTSNGSGEASSVGAAAHTSPLDVRIVEPSHRLDRTANTHAASSAGNSLYAKEEDDYDIVVLYETKPANDLMVDLAAESEVGQSVGAGTSSGSEVCGGQSGLLRNRSRNVESGRSFRDETAMIIDLLSDDEDEA